MDSRVTDLIKSGDRLFSERQPIVSLWQEIAENFYPERADFTVTRNLGTDFAAHLTTSYPILARRELGNTFSAMLRPSGTEWFKIGVSRDEMIEDDIFAKRWLEEKTEVQRRVMDARESRFVRAMSEADHDYAAFGQSCVSVEMNHNADGLLYRCWHLRDVAWAEGLDGSIDTIHRKWKPTAREIYQRFPEKSDAKLKERATKEPYSKIECRHIVIPADQYEMGEGKKLKTPFVSIYVDVTHSTVLEEVGVYDTIYAISRWQTVSGSQYAHSPATIAALPDARLIQAMTLVLLEAGEKAVDPPMIAVQEAIRSDLGLFAGGITWVDAEYDQKTGDVLRPINQDRSGMPLGLNMQQDTRQMISEAFFLNKLNLPPTTNGDMTAYEVSQRIQEYIRTASPLFGATEPEHSGQVCDLTFERLMRGGAFGPRESIPPTLQGQEIQFQFKSPLHDAIERAKGQKFMELRDMMGIGMQIDPTVGVNVDIHAAFRDVLDGISTPAEWIVPIEQADQARAEIQQQQQDAATEQQATQSADDTGKAMQELVKGGMALDAA